MFLLCLYSLVTLGGGGKVILNNLVDHSQVFVVPLPDAPVGEMQFV